jgi:hypothetical protein
VYVAGKISKDDFRHRLVTGLSKYAFDRSELVTPGFTYVGPFFVSCDHGCYHGKGTHGATSELGCEEEIENTRLDVIKKNNAAIDSADLVFAYITATDCYGTMVEIGRVTSNLFRPRLAIAFAPGVPVDDFWYGAKQADSLYYDVRECCLSGLINTELKELQLNQSTLNRSKP